MRRSGMFAEKWPGVNRCTVRAGSKGSRSLSLADASKMHSMKLLARLFRRAEKDSPQKEDFDRLVSVRLLAGGFSADEDEIINHPKARQQVKQIQKMLRQQENASD